MSEFYATMDECDDGVCIWFGKPFLAKSDCGDFFAAGSNESRCIEVFHSDEEIFPDLFANLKPGDCKRIAPPVIRFLEPELDQRKETP